MSKYTLGLDIGSNSVGSAWVDLDTQEIHLGCSVFPAGVEEREDKRGSPKNQARRNKRSMRRTLRRKAQRKRRLRKLLMDTGLLPNDSEELRKIFGPRKKDENFDLEKWNPWRLRCEGLERPLDPYEFGRVLIHLNQRRGAMGFDVDADDEGKVKSAIDHVRMELLKRYAKPQDKERLLLLHDSKDKNEQKQFPIEFSKWIKDNDVTFGRMMYDLLEERISEYKPILNRQDSFEFHADRSLIRDEFKKLWEKQKSFGGELTQLLTDELCKKLDDPAEDETWRHKGELFGQRRTYWDTGTLGRCVLEPTDRCVPIADMYAQYFRVIETVNNIRIYNERHQERPPLTNEERDKVIGLLRGPLFKKSKGKIEPKSSASVTDIRKILGISFRDKSVGLNIEKDEEREINTDWFHREVIHNAIGLKTWQRLDERKRERINRAILKYDLEKIEHAEKFRREAINWWGLSADAADELIKVLESRPKLGKRLNLSRRAILNLLPYMNEFDSINNRWPTQQEARKAFAEDAEALDAITNCPPDDQARRRYATGALGATSADRYYMKQDRHQIKCRDGKMLPPLPPAPMMSNPVVRKAIHEVRRHIMAYLRKFGCKPDRVIIEFARSAKQSSKVRDAALARNRWRNKIRKEILEGKEKGDFSIKKEFGSRFYNLSLNQQREAVDRVLLARQQRWQCPYCGESGLTDSKAALGHDVEIDHIVPYSRCGDNGWNNKVLCHIECNRNKRKRTPREWWLDRFNERSRIAKKLFDGVKPDKTNYFTKKDYARKWHNFTREVKENEWRNSQGADTAYASKQVAAYLSDALFDGKGLPERGGKRKIFVTIGKYTAMLRRDWQLFETLKRSRSDGEVNVSKEKEAELEMKNRGDHRQHAIDAVVIALTTPDIISNIAQRAAKEEEIFAEHGHWPGQKSRREACQRCQGYRNKFNRFPGEYEPIIPPQPWNDVKQFRRFVLSKVYDSSEESSDLSDSKTPLIVAHRPVKRRIAGAFHEDTLFGTVKDSKKLFTGRIQCYNPPDTWLKPGHLRMSKPETEKQSVARLVSKYIQKGLDKKASRKKAKETVKKPDFTPKLVDPSPSKSGLVRDRVLREHIRQCLKANNIDPDKYTKADMKKMMEQGLLRMYSKFEWEKNSKSNSPEKPRGVPIKSVVLLRKHTDPVVLHRKKWDPTKKRIISDEDPRTRRVYVGGNNHHIEIREDKKGKWDGEIVTNFEAAQRNDQRLQMLKKAGVPSIRKLRLMKRNDGQRYLSIIKKINRDYPVVDRSDLNDKRFIMSLAEGETICMRHPETGKKGFFVVFKLEKPRTIYFKHHWDARPAGGLKDDNNKVIAGSKRKGFSVSAADLKKKYSFANGEPPYKVWVGPLGDIKKLHRD